MPALEAFARATTAYCLVEAQYNREVRNHGAGHPATFASKNRHDAALAALEAATPAGWN